MTDQDANRAANAAVAGIVADLTDRRGLRQSWETIDDDIKSDILDKWWHIVRDAIIDPDAAAAKLPRPGGFG